MFDGSLTEYTTLKDHEHRMARLTSPQATYRRELAAMTRRARRTPSEHATAPRTRTRLVLGGVMGLALTAMAGLWAALSTPPADMIGLIPGIHDTSSE
jgi:hypothetical protein